MKVSFHLTGEGVVYDPSEPIHLDSLLTLFLAQRQGIHQHLQREDIPEPVKLPLVSSQINGQKVWHASALQPEGPAAESLQHWRKRFRHSRIDLSSGSPNTTNGTYRDWQMPLQPVLCTKMVAYCRGFRRPIHKELKRLRYLGKKHAHGWGKIIGLSVENIEEDLSLIRVGRAMRWIPMENGSRRQRCKPPYWHPHETVECCAVGEEIEL